MRTRWRAIPAVLGLILLAGCVAVEPPQRRESEPFAIPQDLSWQCVIACSDGDCAAYRFADRAEGFTYVDAYERARLWEYYTAVTVPCLASRGVDLAPIARERFFVPDERPWNPYTSMQGIPFDDLVGLYRACPPVPPSLQSRHEAP
jgi:hypothetical protein